MTCDMKPFSVPGDEKADGAGQFRCGRGKGACDEGSRQEPDRILCGRPAFIRALVAKRLAEGGRDPAAADIDEAGLRSWRDGYEPLLGGHQRPVTYYPGLCAQAWFDPQAFSWVADLEASAPAIREECFAQWRAGTFHTHPSSLPLTTGCGGSFCSIARDIATSAIAPFARALQPLLIVSLGL